MKLTEEFEPIREWASEKGIFVKSNTDKQFLKLLEEVGELSSGIQDDNHAEIKDAIGDCVVVLTNLAVFHGLRIEDCINSAYQVIKNRKGAMINGTFKKEEDAR
jgi:NTP pyrophosphatase (non-canonical NTP hydrolase)